MEGLIWVAMFLLWIFLVLWPIAKGIATIARAMKPPPPPLPEARIADRRRFRGPQSGKVDGWRVVLGAMMVAVGGFVASLPWLVIQAFDGLGMGTMGRPLRLGRRRPARAGRARGDGWTDGVAPALDGVDDVTRSALGAAWHAAAEMEHASIPAFARLSTQLVALGAPAALVRRAHEAALDEIRHAERCFALARAYGGEAWTAGPLPALATAGEAIDLPALAVESLVDGCLGEGLAADVAARGAEMARDPVIASTLEGVAADEAAHAELAWSVLAWCLEVGGAPVAKAVAARVDRIDGRPGAALDLSSLPGASMPELEAHGFPALATVEALARARAAATAARARAMLAPVALAA